MTRPCLTPYVATVLAFLAAGCASSDLGYYNPNPYAYSSPNAPAQVDTPTGRLARICKVSYETEDGWSDEVPTEVQFVTGTQLNRATRSYDYSMFSSYALIWFARGQVAILECKETLLGVGSDFKNSDFRRLFLFSETAEFEQVNSDYPRKWQIRGKELFRFIDPRAEQY